MNNTTALVSCFLRAYHCKNSASPVFCDSAAENILGEDYSAIEKSMTDGLGYFLPDFAGKPCEGLELVINLILAPSVLGRSAYCEKMLENEIALGCGQYVIFAAGYDTYAMRNQNPALKLFELDLPELLSDKRARIERSGLKACSSLIPCDLADNSWTAKLIEGGFCADKKSFGSLLGISYYLEKQDWKSLIAAAGSVFSQGSAICFDYPTVTESTQAQKSAELADEAGEKMKARYSFSELEALLSDCGFLIYEHLDSEAMTQHFFSKYNSGAACPIAEPRGVGCILAVKARF